MKVASPFPLSSSFGRRLTCPNCGRELVLVDLRDEDQGYWCYGCNRGWRAGTVPIDAYTGRAEKQAS